MIKDMPLPIPRLVISSPIHISSAAPAVKVVTMSSTRAGVKIGTRSMLPAELLTRPPPPLWNRNTRPVDWSTAMPIVR